MPKLVAFAKVIEAVENDVNSDLSNGFVEGTNQQQDQDGQTDDIWTLWGSFLGSKELMNNTASCGRNLDARNTVSVALGVAIRSSWILVARVLFLRETCMIFTIRDSL